MWVCFVAFPYVCVFVEITRYADYSPVKGQTGRLLERAIIDWASGHYFGGATTQ